MIYRGIAYTSSHARVQAGFQVYGNSVRTRLLTVGNHCLEGGLSFGDPFQDSGVVTPSFPGS